MQIGWDLIKYLFPSIEVCLAEHKKFSDEDICQLANQIISEKLCLDEIGGLSLFFFYLRCAVFERLARAKHHLHAISQDQQAFEAQFFQHSKIISHIIL